MPEVALVAILDADKEGFLRSETSLIQTIGRAARNLHGKAILYADKITKSMKKAIDETDRRRAKQIEHNELHGITPKGIEKAVADILETGYPGSKNVRRMLKTAEDIVEYASMSQDQINREIKLLEKQMYKHAENLERSG